MTTATRQHDVVCVARADVRVSVRWEISPDALRGSAGAAILNGHAARMSECALVWEVEGARASAFLEIAQADAPAERLPLEGLTDLAARVERDEGMETWSAGDALVVVLREGALAYARTSVLGERLGLGGGVYDGPV